MTGEHLEAILKSAQAKAEKDGYIVVPEGATMTLYGGHEGVPLTVPRVEAIKIDGELVYARTARRETFALNRGDLFAVALEGAVGQPARRAGFG
ncbi:MAG: hypothetical protein ACLQVI_00870 [Polyangiaceae bacterium]